MMRTEQGMRLDQSSERLCYEAIQRKNIVRTNTV